MHFVESTNDTGAVRELLRLHTGNELHQHQSARGWKVMMPLYLYCNQLLEMLRSRMPAYLVPAHPWRQAQAFAQGVSAERQNNNLNSQSTVKGCVW